MDQIYKFDEFISIFEAKKNISDELFNALAEGVPKSTIEGLTVLPELDGIYTKPSKSKPGLKEIFYKWNGVEKKFQNVFYKDGEIIPDPSLNIPPNDTSFWRNILDPIGDMIKKSIKSRPSILFPISYWEEYMEAIKNLPITKAIESKGIKFIDSSNKKDDMIIIKFPGVDPEFRESIPTFIEKPVKKFLESTILDSYIHYIFNIAKKEGIPDEEISKLTYILSNKGFDNEDYKKKYIKIIKKYPIMFLYLIEPPGGIDMDKIDMNKDVLKGLKIIGRFGFSPE